MCVFFSLLWSLEIISRVRCGLGTAIFASNDSDHFEKAMEEPENDDDDDDDDDDVVVV